MRKKNTLVVHDPLVFLKPLPKIEEELAAKAEKKFALECVTLSDVAGGGASRGFFEDFMIEDEQSPPIRPGWMLVLYKDGKHEWMPHEEYETEFGPTVEPPFHTKEGQARFRALQFLMHLPFWDALAETTQEEIIAVVDANLATEYGWFN